MAISGRTNRTAPPPPALHGAKPAKAKLTIFRRKTRDQNLILLRKRAFTGPAYRQPAHYYGEGEAFLAIFY